MTDELDKMKLHSPDWANENIRKMAEIFPNCVTETQEDDGTIKHAIDYDQLRQELSDHIVDGPQERYHLNWPGKREALLAANAPIAKTLRPDRDESVDFDKTQNLFIEGDNLEALKLLQETYLSKIKMIYIDPPYNTGNDFIYEDDFVESADEFFVRSNQKDKKGNRLLANPDSKGRFHSDWLSMMYSRLKLARNLLKDDGIIVASIDENEMSNLCKIFDDVFGEHNFLFQITLLCNPKGRSQDKFVANCHEYIIGYSKSQLAKGAVNISKGVQEIAKNYKLKNNRGLYRELELRNTHREFGKHNRQNLYYPFYVCASGTISLEPELGRDSIYPVWDDGFEGCWTWGQDKARAQLEDLVAREVKGKWKIFRKNYAEDENGEATKQVKSIWTEKMFKTENGQAAFNNLFNAKKKIFQSPKSVETLRQLIQMSAENNSIILDFFAGSSTTAHAVMQLNAEDGGNRKFIMVQLPEECDPKSEAAKAGFSNIAEISKKRIRLAGTKILEGNCHVEWNKDIGFRTLKIDTSNMKDVYYRPDEVGQSDLMSAIDNIKADRTGEDLLFQVLVDWGVDLTLPIRHEEIDGKLTYFVDDALIACFETGINEGFVKQLAAHKPLRVVFRDNGFASDDVKANVAQIFRQTSPDTDIKVI